MKTAYLQPKGTHTEKAAKIFAQKRGAELDEVLKPSPKAVARSVVSGEAEFGVIAYYNSSGGLVQACLDAIYKYNLHIIGAQRIHVKHSFLTYPGNTDFSKIYSHPQAFIQCEDYLLDDENYSDAEQIAVKSTAAAAVKVKELQSGLAIADAAAFKGLEIVVQDAVETDTDFFLVAKEPDQQKKLNNEYWTMVALNTPEDREGLLHDITGLIRTCKLNLAKIHSRPAMNNSSQSETGLEPQMFYLEIMTHQEHQDLKDLVEHLHLSFKKFYGSQEFVRLLGSYERPSTTI